LVVVLDSDWAEAARATAAVDSLARGVVLHAGGGDYFRSPPMRCGQPDPAGVVHLGFGSNVGRIAGERWSNRNEVRCEAVLIDAAGRRRRFLALDRSAKVLDEFSLG
jgi:hypothetical protein